MSIAPEGLTRSQKARRTRVIAAAMELAGEGGYDAVQMRDVAERADVALGTIYRYFASKDQLLAAALVEWAEELRSQVSQRPLRAEDPSGRLVELLGRATRTMQRSRALTAAVISALTSGDPGVTDSQAQLTEVMSDLMRTALRDVDELRRDDVVRVLSHVWFSAIQAWVHGWRGGIDVNAEVRHAADLLLA
jgi:TetR/AcrR family transcriptional regulator, cholesterol catabolism regulator